MLRSGGEALHIILVVFGTFPMEVPRSKMLEKSIKTHFWSKKLFQRRANYLNIMYNQQEVLTLHSFGELIKTKPSEFFTEDSQDCHQASIYARRTRPAASSESLDFFRFSLISHAIFFSEPFFLNWKQFLDGSERFISAILVSRVKIMIPPCTHLSGRIFENRKMCTRTTPPGSHFGEYLYV